MSGSSVFTSSAAGALKLTLDKIPTDKDRDELLMPKFFDESSMSDNYEDDQEYGGPALASEKKEGAAITIGSINEGTKWRYNARTFALGLVVSEEAMEDIKYKDVIMAAKRLTSSMYQTVDVDAALQLARAWDSNYVGGDNVSLCNSAHPLPDSSTFSNTLATAMSPSRAAVIVMASQALKYPGHNGVTRGYKLKRVLCPTEQWAVWEGLVKSTHAPEAGQFNEINVVNASLDLEVVPNKHWDNTTTNFMIQTDCDYGFRWKWRVKPSNRSWVNNDRTEMRYAVRARWARGWSDARCVIGSQA